MGAPLPMWWRPFLALFCRVFFLSIFGSSQFSKMKNKILYSHRCQRPCHPLFGRRLLKSLTGHINLSLLQFKRARLLFNHFHFGRVSSSSRWDSPCFSGFVLASGSSETTEGTQIKGTLLNLLGPLPSSLLGSLMSSLLSALLGSLLSALLEWCSTHCHWFSTSLPHCWREAAGHNSWKKQQCAKYNSCHARSLHSAISPPICATLRVRFVAAFSEPHLCHPRGQEKEEEEEKEEKEEENRPG